MVTVPAAAVTAAAQRLRGQVVAAPVIGSAWLGGDGRVDVRWKADLLQPGGSGWFRGYLHLLLRSYGALPGVVFTGPASRLLAATVAAQLHRLPIVASMAVAPDAAVTALVERHGGRVEVHADPERAAAALQRQRGYLPLPGIEHPEVAAGIATIGFELGTALPGDCEVCYAPAAVAAAIGEGLMAAGRQLSVQPVPGEVDSLARLEQLRAAVASAHRLNIGTDGAAVLAAALAHGPGAPVGAAVLD